MKKSHHFDEDVAKRPDREDINQDWSERGLYEPEYIEVQSNGRIKHWIYVQEKRRWLRVVILEDGETIHTNFWDRGFERKLKRWQQGHEPGLKEADTR